MRRRIRVLMAKPGLDGHDLGARLVARSLRDAGMEVIYTGRHQTPEQIVAAAVQEDVDVIGISILSGAHLGLARQIMDRLRDSGITEKLVIIGGTIPREDVPRLKGMGVAGVFPVGAAVRDIAQFIERNVPL